jgi:hypothetical protein
VPIAEVTSPPTPVATPPAGATAGPDSPTEPRERPAPRCRWHVLVYLLLLGGLLAGTNLRASWAYDDGGYATQVKVLRQTGQWAYPYQQARIDPHIDHAPVDHAVVTTEGRLYPYVKQPAWIEVLWASTKVFGVPFGLYVPSALGAVAAAAVAWFLAKRFDPGAAPWAFWAVALGPLLVHATAMWAHTTGAALGGLVALFVLDAADGRFGRRQAIGLAATLAAIIALRGEGVLLTAAALPVVALLAASQGRTLVRRALRAASATVAAGVAAVAALLGSREWAHHLAPGVWGGPPEFGYAVGFVQGRIMGAERTLLNGWGHTAAANTMAIVATALMLVAGWLFGRRNQPGAALLAMAAGLVTLVARTMWVAPLDLAGYAAASPLVVVAFGAYDWRSTSRRARALIGVCGLYLLAVLATEYPEGGSRDWGGRYLFLALVPVAVGSVVVVRRRLAQLPAGDARRRVGLLLVALVVVPALLGIYATEGLRDANGAMTTRALSTGTPIVIRTNRAYGRLAWDVLPAADWLTADPASAPALLARLRGEGAGSVTVEGVGADTVKAPGYHRRVLAADLVVFTPSR